MKEIGHIYLSWRKGFGKRRHIVGVLKRNITEGVSFKYFKKGVEEAIKEGFVNYTGFQDIDKIYKENVLEVFGQRIIKSERNDIADFYDFWEIDKNYTDDKYYLLAHTQGLNPSDNFEFLADFKPIKNLSFCTDLAGLSYLNLDINTVVVGDELTYNYEPDNKFDNKAIKIFKGKQHVGYIKKIHSNVFYKLRDKSLKIVVKAIEKNGYIKRIFVTIKSK